MEAGQKSHSTAQVHKTQSRVQERIKMKVKNIMTMLDIFQYLNSWDNLSEKEKARRLEGAKAQIAI